MTRVDMNDVIAQVGTESVKTPVARTDVMMQVDMNAMRKQADIKAITTT